MKNHLTRMSGAALFMFLFFFFPQVASGASATASSPDQKTTAAQVASPAASKATAVKGGNAPGVTMWLHLLDTNENTEIENSSMLAFAPKVPGDLGRALASVGGESGVRGLFHTAFLVVISLFLGFLIVFATTRFANRSITQLEQISPPAGDSLSALWVGFVRSIPRFAGVVLLAVSATIIFLFLGEEVTPAGRMLFQLMLGIIVFTLACSLLSKIVFAPYDRRVRPIRLNDSVAKSLHRATVISAVILLSVRLIGRFIADLGAQAQTVSWVIIILGTTFIVVLSSLVIYLKKPVSASLQADDDEIDNGWIKKQLVAYWHVPTLLYFFVAWFVWIGQQLSGTIVRNNSMLISLFIIPIYLVLSYAGRAIIGLVIDSLGVGAPSPPQIGEKADYDEAAALEATLVRKKDIVSKTYLIFRIILACVIATWTLTLWGFEIPFAKNAMKAIFESLITLALALLVWRVASTYIARKIEEAAPPPSENQDDDDEFGGTVSVSRSHTLLPMVRKVLASTLIVMVSLTIISSLGVNIAPILAGAGVLGLAVGFGAQKLVSDILSGFFFLLDDAFRVGEYIEAGSLKGSVEAITLRNVMLRHTQGMLQIVPHSDLGAITNFMRGGIIVKFPLEFSYDTNIDKVRKIIKKVGQAMLEDEEIKDDFIRPLKSQGVNEITNSVMIIRVKFTAKPGKQFTIKREAFRRITEALAAAGIHYAHRKVIVDFPDEKYRDSENKEILKKAIEGGAAAAILDEIEQQKLQEAMAKEKK